MSISTMRARPAFFFFALSLTGKEVSANGTANGGRVEPVLEEATGRIFRSVEGPIESGRDVEDGD